MKLVIDTQYRENYGAHSWDGEGECPQYWKNKGGSTYVFEGLDPNDVIEGRHLPLVTELVELVENSDEYSQEYVIDSRLLDNDEAVCEDWEAPYIIARDDENWTFTRMTSFDEVCVWKQVYSTDKDGNRIDGSFTSTPMNEAARERQREFDAVNNVVAHRS